MSKIDNFPKSPPKTGLVHEKKLPPYADERFRGYEIPQLRALVEFKKSPIYEEIRRHMLMSIRGLEINLMD
jgi:hypothetical protein